AEPLRRRMILRIAARHPLQHRLISELAEAPARRRVPPALHERLEIFRDRFAHPVETGARRHPDAPAHERVAGLEVEIEAGAPPCGFAPHTVIGVAMPKPARRVR